MAYEVAIVEALAALLEAQGIGAWGDALGATSIALTYRLLPETPNAAIAFTPYNPVDNRAAASDAELSVQLRVRGANPDPRSCDELAEAAFNVLHGLSQHPVGGLVIVDCVRTSSAALGQGPQGLWERTENYRLRTSRYAQHTTSN